MDKKIHGNSKDEQGNAIQYLTFFLKGDLYGIDVGHIREVIDYHDVYPVPLVPGYLNGVINLRGDVVPVINLAARFDLAESEVTRFTSIVIMEVESESETIILGVVIDAVNNVIDLYENEIEPTPGFGTSINTEYISGIGKKNDAFIVLLNVTNALDVEDMANFTALNAGIKG